MISTHTTHVGGDMVHLSDCFSGTTFQLTPPMWVATDIIQPV